MNIAQLDEFLQMDGGVSEIVFPQLSAEQTTLITTIDTQNADLAYLNFDTLAEDFYTLAKSESQGNQIILLVLFVIAAVGVSNTMLMAVLERTKEIGMLRAIGMSVRKIYAMFLLEAVGIGIIGGLFGIVLGAIANIPLVNVGIDYGKWLREFDFGYRIATVFRGAWRVQTFVGAFCTAIILTVLTAIVPIRRILRRLSITDCLRDN